MNREDIIRMARESGIEIDIWEPLYEGDSTGFRVCEFTHEELEHFFHAAYAAGAAAEREACAKLCEHKAERIGWPTERWPADNCAAAIRARGNKT